MSVKTTLTGLYQSTSNHFYFRDAKGASVVLEPIGGSLQVFDNPYGVLTNAPSFDWHTTNLRNYIHLIPFNVDLKTMRGVEVKKLGEGTGMLGIPEDFTPPPDLLELHILCQKLKITTLEK